MVDGASMIGYAFISGAQLLEHKSNLSK